MEAIDAVGEALPVANDSADLAVCENALDHVEDPAAVVHELARALVEADHEIAAHGLRWIHYQNMDVDTERAHMREALEIIEARRSHRSPDGPHGDGLDLARFSCVI